MMMVSCLFVYAMTEFQLRWELQTTSKTVTSQAKKQTRVQPEVDILLFQGDQELKFQIGKAVTYRRHEQGPKVVEGPSVARKGV